MNALIDTLEILDPPEAIIAPAKNIMLEFLTPSQLAAFIPPEGFNLVGNYHIQKGAVFVIGGAPGVGKSRAAVALAVSSATGRDWFGLKVHRKFKTMILQCENGRVRLKNEFADLGCETLDGFIRVCPPPPFGFAFDDLVFREQLRKEIESFKPDVIILDPFNRLAQDDKAKDYMAAFNAVQSVISNNDEIALGIVAHTRKPKADERANGRNALNMLAGSYVLASVPRSAFVIQSASDETTENRVVFVCCKNNDGELGHPTVWERGNGIFRPVENFDWNEFNAPSEQRKTITETDLTEIFGNGTIKLAKKQVVEKLQETTGCGQSAAYNALKRFMHRLGETENGLLYLKP
jgi:energy-coupling factor transporter ATP-binding protein EcfA2